MPTPARRSTLYHRLTPPANSTAYKHRRPYRYHRRRLLVTGYWLLVTGYWLLTGKFAHKIVRTQARLDNLNHRLWSSSGTTLFIRLWISVSNLYFHTGHQHLISSIHHCNLWIFSTYLHKKEVLLTLPLSFAQFVQLTTNSPKNQPDRTIPGLYTDNRQALPELYLLTSGCGKRV